jgi:hypothetical protein
MPVNPAVTDAGSFKQHFKFVEEKAAQMNNKKQQYHLVMKINPCSQTYGMRFEMSKSGTTKSLSP